MGQFLTRQVHNIAIDPLDENYFISAGSLGDPTVSVWDIRSANRVNSATASDGGPTGPLLEFRPAVDNSQASSIWSLRFSGAKRGCFGVLSSTGEIKIIELAQHSLEPSTGPVNTHGASPWSSRHYTRMTHQLQYPWYDKQSVQAENARVIAYDFMSSESHERRQYALALRSSRNVDLLRIPTPPPYVRITAMDEMAVLKSELDIYKPADTQHSIAEDLLQLQQRVASSKASKRTSAGHGDNEFAARLEKLNLENYGHKSSSAAESSQPKSSRELHEELMCLGFPKYKLELTDSLKLLSVQRRRCQEGYLFNYQKNKEIVANDRWLVELWDSVKRFDDLAKDGGMIAEGLDLSYLGVAAIWDNTFGAGSYVNRILDREPPTKTRFVNAVKAVALAKNYPAFEGAATNFPEHRQVCLVICGWLLPKQRLRQRGRELVDDGQCYKAIVWAVIRGFKDIALELLKYAVQRRLVDNIGLGGVIACDTVNDEQRDMCKWMMEESRDPYLRALLTHFVSGNWHSVTDMDQLALVDRVGIALRYLDDDRLGEFIKISTAETIIFGNIEGIILTGLADRAMDLFQNYIAKFNDLQTAVLVMANTNPLYMNDLRFEVWKETYLMQMQAWQTFIERTRFVMLHNRKAITRDGRKLIQPVPRQVTLRCNHCMASLALRPHKNVDSDYDTETTTRGTPRRGPVESSGVLCPHCGRHMPRCGICMMWLGSPDPGKLGGAVALADEDPVAKQILFCMTCTHGFHGHHARDWFARHQTCPVPDCQCMCGLLH